MWEGGGGEKGLNRNFVAVLGWGGGGGGSLKLGILSLGNRVQGKCIVMKNYRQGQKKSNDVNYLAKYIPVSISSEKN